MTIGRRIAPVSASTPLPACTALVENEVSNGLELSGAAAGVGMPPACQGAAAGGDSTGTGRTARPSLNGPGRPLDERHDPGGRGRDCWRRPSLILCQIPIRMRDLGTSARRTGDGSRVSTKRGGRPRRALGRFSPRTNSTKRPA
jgi:hypothetical protein